MRTTHHIGIVLLTFSALAVHAQAAVIIDDAALIDSTFSSPNKLLTLTQSIPTGEGLFAIEVEAVSSSQYNFNYAGIAEEYALFVNDPGVQFTPAFTVDSTPLVSNNGIDPGTALVTFAPSQTKYFSYWDDRNFDSIPDLSDNYGWVALQRVNMSLIVNSSATALGAGIIVGTTTQIPEPSSAALIALGGLIFCAIPGKQNWPNRVRGSL